MPDTAAPEPRKRVRRARPAVAPRLLDEDQAADYIGASPSYVRALVACGRLTRVELPATDGRGGRARMSRFDVQDLDEFVRRLKG
jgi:hypothetical protein